MKLGQHILDAWARGETVTHRGKQYTQGQAADLEAAIAADVRKPGAPAAPATDNKAVRAAQEAHRAEVDAHAKTKEELQTAKGAQQPLIERNQAQADLLDKLAGSEESLKGLAPEHLAAVADFEGVKPAKDAKPEDTVKAILDARAKTAEAATGAQQGS